MILISEEMNVGGIPMMPVNAAKVLLLFRDGHVSNWASLNEALAREIGHYSLRRALSTIVEQLLQAKLLVADNASDYKHGTLRLSDNWGTIQNLLNISLSEMAKVDPDKSMFIQPRFGRPRPAPHEERLDLFVVMPFKPEMRLVYEDHIKNVATSLNLKVARADDFFTAHIVMQDIWTAICRSRIIIADCTSRNPNVFYEIGIAHTVGKPVVLITQSSEDVPFDLRSIRYIPYEYTPPGMSKFESDLANTIKTALRELGS
ncbi:MAG TPA: hypothetical protein VF043_03295 [Ktedonobacteraceae bacterium]